MAQTRPSPTLSRGFTRLGRFLAPYGFREFEAARRTIQGYETMHMIRKGQARWVSGSDIRRQIHFTNKLFEVAA